MLELIINSERLPPLLGEGWRPQAAILAETEGVGAGPAREGGPSRLPASRGRASPTLLEAEEKLIRLALLDAEGKVSKAAKRLGIGRNTLYRKMERYGIVPGDMELRSTTEQSSLMEQKVETGLF